MGTNLISEFPAANYFTAVSLVGARGRGATSQFRTISEITRGMGRVSLRSVPRDLFLPRSAANHPPIGHQFGSWKNFGVQK